MFNLLKTTVAMLCLHLSCMAQRVTITAKEPLSLAQVFQLIERQTNYKVLYSSPLIADAPMVTLNCHNTPVSEVLQRCFAGLQLYSYIDKQSITISRRVATSESIYIPLQGRVVSVDGEPLEGATISLQDGPAETTRAGGLFRMPVHALNSTITVSFLGYSPRTLLLNNAGFYNIGLQSATSTLDHVIVQAYGQTTQRLATVSITTVKGSELTDQPVSSVLAALEGRVPGLMIRQYNGVPGSAYGVLIRGQRSISQGTDPLIVIDGMPVAGGNGSLSTIGSGSAQGPHGTAVLNDIPLSAIGSIEVLRDAAATAIYGSRGANGVLLITLKQGMPGKPKWTVDLNSGVTHVVPTSPLLTTQQYLALRKEAVTNDGSTVNEATIPENFVWDSSRYTDYKKQVMGKFGLMQEARVELCGGDTNTVFLISGAYHRETAVYRSPTNDDRTSLYGHLKHQSRSQGIKLDVSVLYSSESNHLPVQDYAVDQYLAPNAPAFTKNGLPVWMDSGLSFVNIPASAGSSYRATLDNLFLHTQLDYEPLPGLTLKAVLGYNRILSDERSRQTIASQNPAGDPTGANYYTGNSYHSELAEALAEYKRRLGPGRLEALGGLTWQQERTTYSSLSQEGLSSDLPVNTGSGVSSQENQVAYRYAAILGRINYTLLDKYLLTLTGRRDGSSRWSPGNQYGNFWSVSTGWIFSEETAFKDLRWLSFGKLRGSLGTTGNDQTGESPSAQVYNLTTAARPYQGLPGVVPVSFANDNLAWEVNYNSELALDLGFLRNRLLFSVVAYEDWTKNQLVYTSLASQAGLPGVVSNQPANVVNKGLEFSLTTHTVVSKDFRWLSTFLLTVPSNKLARWPSLGSSLYASKLYVGKSLNEFRGYHSLGVETKSGLFTFRETNGKLDLGAGGDFDPRCYGGMGQNFQYKNWQLDLFFEYRLENGMNPLVALYQQNPPGMEAPSMLGNGPKEWLSHWRQPGDKARLEQLTASPTSAAFGALQNYVGSDAWVIHANYIRWKSMSLRYRLPERALIRLHVRSASLYLRGENLLTFTRFPVTDPETQDPRVLPPVRTLLVGAQLTL
jgi:TonB-linked SusC/RagA family outer membrane protein